MRTFGGFKSGEKFFYGEVRDEEVHVLAKPYWIDIEATGEKRKLNEVDVDLRVDVGLVDVDMKGVPFVRLQSHPAGSPEP